MLEYQILRDSFTNGSRPVKVLRDPTDIDAGRTSLGGLYGTGAALTFNYYALTANPDTSYTSTSVTLPLEPYGITHQYQVRVLYSVTPAVVPSTGTGTEHQHRHQHQHERTGKRQHEVLLHACEQYYHDDRD